MSIIIDGYNLLSGAGIVADAHGPYSLEKSRQALLRFLFRVLRANERPCTTVVFDAKQAPPGLPVSFTWREIQVVFAPRGGEADAVIVEMIARSTSPRQLLVVSSDHAIQRAARRRRARYSDSDRWFRDRLRQLPSADTSRLDTISAHAHRQKHGPLDEAEVKRWLAEFNDRDDDASSIEPASDESPRTAERPSHPFPEGYAEDLLDGE